MRETPTTTTNDGMKGSVAITDNSALRTASTSDPIGTISASIMAGITSGNDETTTTTSTTASSLYVELSPDNSSEDNQQRLWNLSKLALTTTTATATTTTTSSIIAASGGESTTSSLSTTYDASTSVTTAPYAVPTTTLDPFDEFGPPEGVEYIFVPLGVVVSVIILSAVVLIISRKRKLERLRHRLMPMYNFDPGEEEEDDWETELLDECYSTHQRRQGYQSMDTEENAELFGGH